MATEKVDVMITKEQLDKRIKELGEQITKDYAEKKVKLICVLKGGAFFACELAKHIKLDLAIDFMAVSSYGSSTVSSGNIKMIKDLDESIEGEDVIVAEDIVDSGRTLSHLLELLRQRNPKSLVLCTMLDKPARREADVDVRYTGFEIPDEFVVGYGLDYDQRYRNLPYIGKLRFVE